MLLLKKTGELKFDIDLNKKCDIFFAMNYFGFSKYNMKKYIIEFKRKGVYVIEDSTHSILSTRAYSEESDFVVASLRKWFPIISGGICLSKIKNKHIYNKTNAEYVNKKRQAMLEKGEYIKQNINKQNVKDNFLDKFSAANKILKENYKNFKIDEESYNILRNIDIRDIIKKRRRNVKIIYNYLKKQQSIRYLRDIDLEIDCPIFVPIFMENTKRNEIKEYLIKNKVYCPNHWPIPEIVKENKMKEIYNKELSLICDQRYNEKQIEEYITLIRIRS
jgi:dTDP-4-amino-4,6-dideoxygalactose transaminase